MQPEHGEISFACAEGCTSCVQEVQLVVSARAFTFSCGLAAVCQVL